MVRSGVGPSDFLTHVQMVDSYDVVAVTLDYTDLAPQP